MPSLPSWVMYTLQVEVIYSGERRCCRVESHQGSGGSASRRREGSQSGSAKKPRQNFEPQMHNDHADGSHEYPRASGVSKNCVCAFPTCQFSNRRGRSGSRKRPWGASTTGRARADRSGRSGRPVRGKGARGAPLGK